MIKTAFKAAVRRLFKHKLFSLINVIGLSTGLASIMALVFLGYQYFTANKQLKDVGQLYYLKVTDSNGRSYMETPYPLLGEIVKSCPEVDAATHIQQWYYPWLKYGDREFQETTEFADTGYFRVFPFPFKYGNPASALKEKYSVVLSEEIANKIFGEVNPVGRILRADDSISLTVTGVLAHIPTNSSVRPSILLTTALLEDAPGFKSMAGWYNSFTVNYIRLRHAADPASLDGKIAAIIKQDFAPELKSQQIHSVPFSQINQEDDVMTGTIVKGALGAGVLILLIMLINLINLNLAITHERTREVALRQVMGSGKGGIIWQFCLENGLMVVFSLLLAWILFSLALLPWMNAMVGDRFGMIEIHGKEKYPVFIGLLLLGMLITAIASSFPAWKLARIRVRDGLLSTPAIGSYKKNIGRSTLILAQFTLAIMLISVALAFQKQMAFMKASPLGFHKDNVAVVNLDLSYQDPKAAASYFPSILNRLTANPHVLGVSTSRMVPTAYREDYNDYEDPAGGKKVHLRQASIDAGYLPTYGIQLLQGRNFNDALAATESGSVIVNEAAVRAFGWKDPIGKRIKAGGEEGFYTVIGVTSDFHYESLRNKVQPLAQLYGGKSSLDNRYLSVHTEDGYMPAVMQTLKKSFERMPSRRPFSYTLMADKLDVQYSFLDGLLKTVYYVALLTVIIAGMGLFGLAAIFAGQRTKEIGIRRVLGAGIADLLKLLSGNFILLVALAMIVSAPLAWYVLSRWLQYFAYRVSLTGWLFAEAGGLALLLAGIILGTQVIRAATNNPVSALRNE